MKVYDVVARVLKDVVERKLVRQLRDEGDQRRRPLFLTAQGFELEAQLSAVQQERLAKAFAVAGPEAISGWRQMLETLVDPADRERLTRAAERLHIAQPPLSRQIQQLEEEIGVLLFERGSRPLKLTEAGRFFHAHARQLLAQTAELASMTQRVGQIERRMSIGFVASTLYGMLPKVIRRFRAEYPMVDLTMHEMTTMDQIQALKDGRIDVGFGRIRYEDPNVRRILLRDERLDRAVLQRLDLIRTRVERDDLDLALLAGLLDAGGGALSNGGETLKLEDADNGTILEFAYQDSEPWPV